jgi:hypothetical protein
MVAALLLPVDPLHENDDLETQKMTLTTKDRFFIKGMDVAFHMIHHLYF